MVNPKKGVKILKRKATRNLLIRILMRWSSCESTLRLRKNEKLNNRKRNKKRSNSSRNGSLRK